MDKTKTIMWLNGTVEMTDGKVYGCWKSANTTVRIIRVSDNVYTLLIGNAVIATDSDRRALMSGVIVNRDTTEVFFHGELVGFSKD